MGYFKNKLRKFINWATSDNYTDVAYANGISSSKSSNKIRAYSNEIENHGNGLAFTVYSAVGGKVIQTRSYNVGTDRHTSNLYIITDKEDLGHELGHILTVESLSR